MSNIFRAVRERKEMEDVKKDVLAEIDKTLEAERAHIDKRTEEVLQAIVSNFIWLIFGKLIGNFYIWKRILNRN